MVVVDEERGAEVGPHRVGGRRAVRARLPLDDVLGGESEIAVGPEAKGSIDITAPAGANLHRIARALDVSARDLTVVVLDRPRHTDLLSEIRAIQPMVALALTGYGMRADLDRYEHAGFDGSLVKPVTLQELLETLEELTLLIPAKVGGNGRGNATLSKHENGYSKREGGVPSRSEL